MTTNANIDDLDINGEGDLIFLSKGRVTVPKQIIFRKSSKGRGALYIVDFGPLYKALNGAFREKIAL